MKEEDRKTWVSFSCTHMHPDSNCIHLHPEYEEKYCKFCGCLLVESEKLSGICDSCADE